MKNSMNVSIVGMLALACLVLPFASAEIRDFSLLLNPISKYVHFTEGFLLTPGFVDLRQLKFKVVGDKIVTDVDDEVMEDTDDTDGESVGDGNRRQLRDGFAERGDSDTGTSLDVAVFHLPQKCARTRAGCDWPDLGIGKRSDKGQIRYCCSNDAIDLGLCEGNQYGRLIMDAAIFEGQHRFLNIPSTGSYDNFMKYGKFPQKGENGKYVIAMANCNDEGRPVLVSGKTVWMSDHGFLPGDLFGRMYFMAGVTVLYFILLLWYGISMRVNEDDYIPIQKWILVTIAMGTLELFFRSGDLFVWNEDGTRFWFALYVGIVMGILKDGISRGLIVMVALGWGVIRDDLGPVMKKIKFLVTLYIGVSLVRDLMKIIGAVEVHKLSEGEETEIVDVVDILTVVIAFLEILFFLWIIDSLNATMEYLENMGQALKLQRYLRLRAILLISIVFAIMWAVFSIVDSNDEGIVSQESRWVLDAFMEVDYLFVLAGVALLWRPSPDAKSYAYVMELPSIALDDEGDGEDDDDYDDAYDNKDGNGFHDVPSAQENGHGKNDDNGADVVSADGDTLSETQSTFRDELDDEDTASS
mmetsp:Transcript_16495/g.46059  ORF Transcript_16495/g.46059 Transcript_16495/m.46059 type:complete len:583 (-) Transcript_16495:474-2222(-)